MISLIHGFIFVFSHPLNKGRFFSTLLRVLWWKCNQLFFHAPAIIELTNNIRCICYPKSSYGSLIVYTKLPEYEEMSYVLRTLKNDSVFVDIGAGLGDYSLLASSKITKGSIYSFEPHPVAYAQLQENSRLNNLENIIHSEQIAISNTTGTISFSAKQVSELSAIAIEPDANAITVPTTTLDAFCAKNKIAKINLIKVDVEGAELLVFEGAKNLLKLKQINQILFELNAKSETVFGNSFEKTLDYLAKNHFVFFFSDDFEKQVPVSKIIQGNTTKNVFAKLVLS